jgi:hypothetical protein
MNLLREFKRWLWTKTIKSSGYHSFKYYKTPFGIFWRLNFGYWGVGITQFFFTNNFFFKKITNRIKL